MDRVNDLLEMRIDAALQEMSGSALCVLPEDEPITCEDFVRNTRVKTLAPALSLSLSVFSLSPSLSESQRGEKSICCCCLSTFTGFTDAVWSLVTLLVTV